MKLSVLEVTEQIKNLRVKGNGPIYIADLKKIVSKIRIDHELAQKLWLTKDNDLREIAIRIADATVADEDLLNSWVKDLDSWHITDSFVCHLVKYSKLATKMVYDWVKREPEFEKRAGYALIAVLAWTKNDYADHDFLDFLPLIEASACDDRFYVKKAVNWALRDIGKRNSNLNQAAQNLALKLQASEHKTAQWVGKHRAKEIFGWKL